MSIFSDIWHDLFGPKKWAHPDDVEVHKHYRAQVRHAFWEAAARLESVGIFGHEHKIKKVDIRPGTILREKGWALQTNASPTGYAGGWCGSASIVLASDPNTGAVPDSNIIHEWAHAIMDKANVYRGNAHEQHKIMARAGI